MVFPGLQKMYAHFLTITVFLFTLLFPMMFRDFYIQNIHIITTPTISLCASPSSHQEAAPVHITAHSDDPFMINVSKIMIIIHVFPRAGTAQMVSHIQLCVLDTNDIIQCVIRMVCWVWSGCVWQVEAYKRDTSRVRAQWSRQWNRLLNAEIL